MHNGDVVRQGEVIGTVGNTDGNASGPLEAHLHFEFRNRGSGEGYPDYIRPASFHGDPFDYATGEETYVSQNCGTSDRASKSIDGDKYDDAIGVDPDGVVWVYHGSSGGGFGTATRLGPGWGAFSRIGIGDSNADGYADLWAVGSGTLYYWNNRHDGTFSAADAVGPGWSAFEWVAFADVTGDGRTDVLARDGGNMYLYPGQGNGAFATRSLVGSGWSSLLRHTAADADDDRDGDIWATNSAGELYFWKRGSAGYATAVQVGTGWNAFRQMTSMDINGDGKADLIAIRTSDNTLWRWLGTGTGTFAQGTQIGHGWAGYTLAAN
ncbi:MAG: VCBS repeat domain-containing M23 family metallopeptidase [Saccharothrix sp.]|nr:VCBS repeat domain-containing M23 family metallopeptidase [Saccharothrix sp.]